MKHKQKTKRMCKYKELIRFTILVCEQSPNKSVEKSAM